MVKTVEVNEETAFEQDVKTMTYEELMATIRFLDEERKTIAERVENRIEPSNDKIKKPKKVA